MVIDSIIDRMTESGLFSVSDRIAVSSALWAIVALRNTEPVIYSSICKTYGTILDTIEEVKQ